MNNFWISDIDLTLKALEQTIEKKQIQIQNARIQSSYSPIVSYLFSEIINKAGGSYGQIGLALEQGGDIAKNLINKAQKSVEERPWEFIRNVAIYSLGIGLFLSLRKRRKT